MSKLIEIDANGKVTYPTKFETLGDLAALASHVKYVDGDEERALIAWETACLEVSRGGDDDAMYRYGKGRRILMEALKWGRERCVQCGNPMGLHKLDCGARLSQGEPQ